MTDLAAQLISEEEGESSPTVYFIDGLAHIGRGVCVDPKVAGAGIPPNVLAMLDTAKIMSAEDMANDLPGFQRCNDVRQAVCVSMCYQLGTLADWPQFKAALAAGEYDMAADAMLDSKWAIQTPARALRQATMMRTGEWSE